MLKPNCYLQAQQGQVTRMWSEIHFETIESQEFLALVLTCSALAFEQIDNISQYEVVLSMPCICCNLWRQFLTLLFDLQQKIISPRGTFENGKKIWYFFLFSALCYRTELAIRNFSIFQHFPMLCAESKNHVH